MGKTIVKRRQFDYKEQKWKFSVAFKGKEYGDYTQCGFRICSDFIYRRLAKWVNPFQENDPIL